MSPVRAKNEPSGSQKRLSPRASSSIWISNPVCTATKAGLFGGSTGWGAGSGRGDVAAPAPLAQQFVDEGFMSKRLHQTRSIKRGDATNQLALHYRTSPLSSGVTLGSLHPSNWMPDARLDDVKRLFDHLRGSHATELVTTEGLRILIAAA